MSNHSLIAIPDDSEQPFLDALNKARESQRVKMFVFSDPALIDSVMAGQARRQNAGMLNPARRSGVRRTP